jgi:hypothetical protein
VYEGSWSSHCEGAAQILKVRGYYDRNNDFECKLLLALRGSVVWHVFPVQYPALNYKKIFGALLSDKIHLSSWDWKNIVENELDGVSCEGRMMRCLARVPDLMQRGRDAMEGGGSILELRDESRSLYHTMKAVLRDLHDRFMNQTANGASQPAIVAVKLDAHYQRSYALGLAITIILNCVLSGFDAQDISLGKESTHFSREIIVLADQAAIYRPIAASYISLCAIAAWGGATDDATKAEAKNVLVDYLLDFSYAKVVVPAAELERIFRRLRLTETGSPKFREGKKLVL